MSEPPETPPLWWYTTRSPELPAPHEIRRARRRRQVLDALACLAVAALCFSQASRETLFRADRDFYNRLVLGPPTLEAFILSLVALAAAGFVVIQVIRRADRPGVRRLAAVAAAAAPPIALQFVRITYETLARLTDALGRPVLFAVAVVMLAM